MTTLRANTKTFRVRLERPWHHVETDFGDILLSTRVPMQEADALLVDFDPTPNLFSAKVPSAWYCGEPLTSARGHHRNVFNQIAKWRLRSSQFLHHAHPDPRYRVPAVAAPAPLIVADSLRRQTRAVAVVSYHGDPGRRWTALRRRNLFATHPLVDLFGNEAVWKNYRAGIFSRPSAPANYRGALPGSYGSRPKLATLCQYQAAVCLENTDEPYYFTEKFFDVVQAGCVPIYHAHPTVAASFLQGARWVDPAEFGFDPQATIEFALRQDAAEWARINRSWAAGPAAQSTTWAAVFERACRILRDQATSR